MPSPFIATPHHKLTPEPIETLLKLLNPSATVQDRTYGNVIAILSKYVRAAAVLHPFAIDAEDLPVLLAASVFYEKWRKRP